MFCMCNDNIWMNQIFTVVLCVSLPQPTTITHGFFGHGTTTLTRTATAIATVAAIAIVATVPTHWIKPIGF